MTPSDRERSDPGSLFDLDGAPGPAKKIDAARAAALVDGALDAALGPAEAGARDEAEAPTTVHRPLGARRRARGVWLAAAAVLLVAGGAGAAAWVALRAPAVERLPAPPAPGAERAPGAVPEPPADEALAPEPAPAPPPPEVAPLAEDPADDEIVIDMPAHRKRPHAAPAREAEDLLARANALRGERRWREADDVYQEVARRYPKSGAAHVALTASGALHLEHLGDPRGARVLFQRALAADADGPLAGEARWGLARAARALGDEAGERRALEELLARHPDSPHRERAKQRLAELP
jgi:tetratricopeptide (TPR) repeat protein